MNRTISLISIALAAIWLSPIAHAQKAPAAKPAAVALGAARPTGAAASTLKKDLGNAGVYVRVNGQPISTTQYQLALQIAVQQGATDSPELRSVLRAQMIAQELMRQEALKQNLQNDPTVLLAREQAGNAAMLQRYLTLAIKPEAVTEETVRARYEEIIASLGDKEYKPRAIAVSTEVLARDIVAKLRNREGSFEDLARKYSVLPSAAKGGAMDWISFKTPAQEGKTQGLPLEMANGLASLKAGGILAEPIAFGGNYYIVGLDDSRPTTVPKYEDVKAALRLALENQAKEKATASLMSRLINSARIE